MPENSRQKVFNFFLTIFNNIFSHCLLNRFEAVNFKLMADVFSFLIAVSPSFKLNLVTGSMLHLVTAWAQTSGVRLYSAT